jgi:hypothetical protein
MALYDNLFTMMDLQAAQVCYVCCPKCRTSTFVGMHADNAGAVPAPQWLLPEK